MSVAYIGLGSNLQQPIKQIEKALLILSKSDGLTLIKASALFISKAMGPLMETGNTQPDYINAVAQIETELTPIALLDVLQSIENQQGRIREQRWQARTLDLDLLLFNQEVIDQERLQVPHPGIIERDFVYQPLLMLNPELHIPDIGLLKEKTSIEPNSTSVYGAKELVKDE